MSSLILRTATHVLMPLMLMFGVFQLMRGHNAPGGGFVGGLIVSAAYALHSYAFGVHAARRALLVDPSRLTAAGLLIALACGTLPVLSGQPFLKSLWLDPSLGIGTPLFFDIGVFLVVVGVVLTMTFTLAEE